MPYAKVVFQTVILTALILTVSVSLNFAQGADSLKYAEMTEGEKRKFIEAEANKILSLFRRVEGDELDRYAVDRIKTYVDGYSVRTRGRQNKPTKCSFGDSLKTVLERGASHAPTIRTSFTGKKIPVQVGLYIAMIETEFCPCLQAPTGALGMFQFTKANGEAHGLKTIQNASPQNPDDRCQPDLAAQAAATYFDKLLNQIFGRNAYGFPLSVMAYNAGEGSTRVLLRDAKAEISKDDISFWMLTDFIEKKWNSQTEESEADQKPETPARVKQFLSESEKYVQKFFAAAIIGENPKVFGLEMTPLSEAK